MRVLLVIGAWLCSALAYAQVELPPASSTASSEVSGFVSENAHDSNNSDSSRWEAVPNANGNAWVTYSYSEPVTVQEYTYYNVDSSALSELRPGDVSVWVNDGSGFVEVHRQQFASTSGGLQGPFTVSSEMSGSQVRFLFRGSEFRTDNFAVNEFTAFGVGGGDPPDPNGPWVLSGTIAPSTMQAGLTAELDIILDDPPQVSDGDVRWALRRDSDGFVHSSGSITWEGELPPASAFSDISVVTNPGVSGEARVAVWEAAHGQTFEAPAWSTTITLTGLCDHLGTNFPVEVFPQALGGEQYGWIFRDDDFLKIIDGESQGTSGKVQVSIAYRTATTWSPACAARSFSSNKEDFSVPPMAPSAHVGPVGAFAIEQPDSAGVKGSVLFEFDDGCIVIKEFTHFLEEFIGFDISGQTFGDSSAPEAESCEGFGGDPEPDDPTNDPDPDPDSQPWDQFEIDRLISGVEDIDGEVERGIRAAEDSIAAAVSTGLDTSTKIDGINNKLLTVTNNQVAIFDELVGLRGDVQGIGPNLTEAETASAVETGVGAALDARIPTEDGPGTPEEATLGDDVGAEADAQSLSDALDGEAFLAMWDTASEDCSGFQMTVPRLLGGTVTVEFLGCPDLTTDWGQALDSGRILFRAMLRVILVAAFLMASYRIVIEAF